MPLHMCVGTGPEAHVSPEGPQPAAQPGRGREGALPPSCSDPARSGPGEPTERQGFQSAHDPSLAGYSDFVIMRC